MVKTNDIEKKETRLFPLNLQFFAEKADEEVEDVEDEETEEEEVEETEDDDKSKSKGKSTTNKDSKKNEKTFTQAQVNRMMTREKSQGRNAAMKELGLDPKDPKMVQMVKALIESQKTDEQKANEAQAEEQAKLTEAENRAMVAEAKAEAMILGVKPQFVDDVVTLAISKMTDDSDLKTIIGEFKTKYAVWFGESDEDEDENVGKKGTGSSVKSSSKKGTGKDNKGLGARLAAQRKGNGKKSSYWGK